MSDPVPGSVPGVPAMARADGTDWPQQAAGIIVDKVGAVRDKTTGPILSASRWVVYGTLAALLAVLILLLLVVAVVRGATEVLQELTGEQDIVWLTYALIGIPNVGAGLWLWSRRRPTA